jgi:hypothetical protein
MFALKLLIMDKFLLLRCCNVCLPPVDQLV